jgi:ATP-dependent DNA helicase RecQ
MAQLDIERLARRGLGIDRLRPAQRQAVEAAIGGDDVLAVMPTGYGKSAIYQIVGAAVDGPTLVVSPLIALQHDQVESLNGDRVGDASAANSSMNPSQREEAFEDMRSGDLEFMFLAPEQLARADTIQALRDAAPTVFVVDEAHCISSWGHDFRPDYLALGRVIEDLGHPIVIALTATAAPPVRAEIIERLGLRDPIVIVRGFDRPELRLSVEHAADAREKDERLVDRVTSSAAGHRAGIVYVGTRKRSEELAEELVARGVRADAYHAGLPASRRQEVHEGFLAGSVDVVVATTAFGMGIDKPDVRFVVHGDVAESLDAYYQEIGRAGRDGQAAEVILFYRAADLGLRRFLGAGGGVDADSASRVLEALDAAGGSAPLEAIDEAVELSRRKVRLSIEALREEGAVELEGHEVTLAGREPSEAVRAVEEREERRRQVEASRLEMMRGYAETRTCRRRFLLNYFGEEYDRDCGACDNCETGSSAGQAAERGEEPFPSGVRVTHADWGGGQVVGVEGDVVTVLFDDVGYKTLSAELSRSRDLLTVTE